MTWTMLDVCFENPDNCPDNISECFARTESPCNGTTWSSRYDNPSAAWVVQCAILMFFMKAGFLFTELSFSKSDGIYRRRVVLVKYVDIFAGTFGFWLFGYALSGNTYKLVLGEEQDYIFWFFRVGEALTQLELSLFQLVTYNIHHKQIMLREMH